MKNKNKITSALKLRQGICLNWNFPIMTNYSKEHKTYQILRYWLLALNDIPLNYLLFKYISIFWKQHKRALFLKYRFLKKNILKKKTSQLLRFWKKKSLKNNNLRNAKFWRPKYVTTTQFGKLHFQWYQTGLHVNIPLFFLPSKARVFLRKAIKKNKIYAIKKSKLQVVKLFFMKLILERLFFKTFQSPVFLNFRFLTLTSKKDLRLQTNQLVIFKDFFFLQKDRLFRRTISAFTFGLYFCQSQMIAHQIAVRLTRTRKHYRTLYQLKQVLHTLRLLSPETSGYQVDVYGKIGAKTRTKFFRMVSGKTPKFQKLATKVHYTYQECFTYTGVFGVHVWLCAGL